SHWHIISPILFIPLLYLVSIIFSFSYYGHHRDLHSFPTRRSSDLRPSTSASATTISRARRSRARSRRARRSRTWNALLAAIVLADRKSTRLNSSHLVISYAVFCLKKKKNNNKLQPSSLSHEIIDHH